MDLGHFVKIAVNHEVVQLLADDGTCVASYGADGSFDGCMYEKLRQINMDELECTVPWLFDQSNICTDPDSMKQAFDLYQKNRR